MSNARRLCSFLQSASIVVALAILPGVALAGAAAAPNTSLALMPYPADVQLGAGEFRVDNSFGVALEGYREPRLERARKRFLNRLSRATGLPLYQKASLNQPNFFINTDGPSDRVQRIREDESYKLVVTPEAVHLSAANPLGILHGLQTFLQLVRVTPSGFSAPAVTIRDWPRFPWRGLMIDTSRHFMPLSVIKQNLNAMEAVKMNIFHWHLSDDQGFRAQSKVYPLLQEKGSDGLYYTQAEIRGIISYARDRGIIVVPEFDMPAHTASWFPGYPWLASAKGPFHILRTWGVNDPVMDPTRQSTYSFINRFIAEMAALFPSPYFHTGGDENNGKEWKANPRIQAFARAHGLTTTAELQAYFTGRVEKIVAAHHKTMIGWDEVLQPNTPHNVMIESWRGQASLAEAAGRGYRAILAAGYYLDLNQPASQHYLVDPMSGAQNLTLKQKNNILGGEAAMWTEFTSRENIDCHIWPRAAAIAERLWSPARIRNIPSMYRRLAVVSRDLQYYGLNDTESYGEMLQRMTGRSHPAALRVLGDVVQPPEGYRRHDAGVWTPLNQLVDAIPPESNRARKFSLLADRLAAGTPSPQDWDRARRWLTLWRNNDSRLQPLLSQSSLTADLGPVSTTLRKVAETGLEAVGYLQSKEPAPVGWKTSQLAFLKQAAQPQANLVDMIAPAVAKLVAATATK